MPSNKASLAKKKGAKEKGAELNETQMIDLGSHLGSSLDGSSVGRNPVVDGATWRGVEIRPPGDPAQDVPQVFDGASSMGEPMDAEDDPEAFRKELEKLQIATIYSLVETPNTMSGGTMNMLFLTNHQAKAFDFSDIEKVMNAMDIKPRPKLIVTIFKSYIHLAGTLHQELTPEEDELFSPHNYVAETDRSRLEEANRKIASFLKEHLLPVCIKTHAIVFLGDASCALSDAFGNICVAERNKRNGVLPFTTMAITGAHVVANRAQHDDNSRARLIRHGSRRWRQYNNKMIDIFGNAACTNKEQAGDFPAGLTHAILISSIDDEKQKKDFKPYKAFRTALAARLSRELPSIAFQTNGNSLDPLGLYSDYVGRNLPLVFIDTRPSPLKLDQGTRQSIVVAGNATQVLQQKYYERAKAHLESIEDELAKTNTYNFYVGSTISFLHTQIHEFSQARKQLGEFSSQADEKAGQWLYLAIKEKEHAVEMEGSEESEELPENVLARQFCHLYMELEKRQDANRRRFMLAEFDSFILDIQSAGTVDEFDAHLQRRTLHWAQSNFYVGGRPPDLDDEGGQYVDMFWVEFPNLFTKMPYFRNGRVYASYASVQSDRDPEAGPVVLEELVAAASSLVQKHRKFIVEYELKSMPMFEFLALNDILTSPAAYSGNISEPSKLASIINQIARIDRLPHENNLAGLHVLQFSWDAVDIFNDVGSKMKIIAKVSYVTLLFLGIAIGTLTIYHLNEPEKFGEDELKMSASYLSLLSGILTGFVTIISPAQKWTRLRGAALAIESEVWQFRTRSGIYVQTHGASEGDENSVEQIFRSRVEHIKTQVLKSSGVLNTAFMSLFQLTEGDIEVGPRKPRKNVIFRHGQHKGCLVAGTFRNSIRSHASPESAERLLKKGDGFSFDDFYSPCRPASYIKFRVEKALKFYQQRIPVYNSTKFRTQSILLVGAFSGVILANLDLTQWVAVFTALAGGITAWSEFHATGDKLERYSDAVAQLDSIFVWWKMLSPVDHASVSCISELVARCENVLKDERQAWVSMNFDQKKNKTAKSNGESTSVHGGNSSGNSGTNV